MNKPTLLKRAISFLCVLTFGLSSTVFATSVDYLDKPWTFNIGGGYTPVVGGLNAQLTSDWNFALGTTYNVNEKLGFELEYMNNHLGIERGVLDHYAAIIGAPTHGNVDVWGLTLNPTWKFNLGRRAGAYLIGGGGYYHVNAQITTPGAVYQPPYCDPWWGCWGGGIVPADFIVAEHKDDTGGVNFGGGFTWKFSPDVEFYIESRYHYILTHGAVLQLLPLTAGLRF